MGRLVGRDEYIQSASSEKPATAALRAVFAGVDWAGRRAV